MEERLIIIYEVDVSDLVFEHKTSFDSVFNVRNEKACENRLRKERKRISKENNISESDVIVFPSNKSSMSIQVFKK